MDDNSSPFFISTADSPGLTLVSNVLLGENNYNTWRRSMIIALEARNKLSFVDGSILVPLEADPIYPLWSRNNKIVVSWILNSISKELVASVIYSSTAATIWQDLHNRFNQQNGPRIF